MQVMRLWAGGKTWAVTGEGFDPHGFFLDTEGAKGDVSAGRDPRQMLMISAYCNEAWLAEIDGRPAIQGNPTDGALVVAAAKADIHRAALKEKNYETLGRLRICSWRSILRSRINATATINAAQRAKM
jgi:Ca2+-transporting ATPase